MNRIRRAAVRELGFAWVRLEERILRLSRSRTSMNLRFIEVLERDNLRILSSSLTHAKPSSLTAARLILFIRLQLRFFQELFADILDVICDLSHVFIILNS